GWTTSNLGDLRRICTDLSPFCIFQHLVTFSIGDEDDLATVEDATRKLSVMDAQGKIWVQEMLLQVNGSAIKLFDIDSKEELENYGLAAVARCEAVRPESRSQSLLLLVCQEPHQLKPDVHFFECDHVGAELIQQDINGALLDFKSGGNTHKPELLNHVFDDVEAFIGKLQKSAEAFRVLDQRKRSAKGRRRGPGEGLLTIRSRPPPQEEFEDALAKMKYSFSLLARLKSNIANPTSEELIHFLFNPLKLVVESSGGPSFASELRSPMLTLEAVTLMRGCLGDQETELWYSLGENWTRPRVDFPRGYADPYNPTFRSGWETPRLDASGQPWEDPVEMQHRHEERRAQVSDEVESRQDKHLRKHPESKSVISTHNFTARNNNELSVLHGEMLQVLDDSKKWWKVQNHYGQVGYVPYNILAPVLNHNSTPQVNGTSPAISKVRLRALIRACLFACLILFVVELCRFNTVNEELALRLANGTTSHSRNLHIQRAADTNLPLGYDSDPAQVRTWLEAKGFSPLTVSALGVLNGAQLFSLKKDEFRAVSPEEGVRVYSQVTVQRALLEDSGKVSELEAVMAKQKRKLEGLNP
uniref:EPS8 signaling adaptor L1 n=1 Tax=Podarcis muralis TaxID=64176 RepID=A0A670K1D2_PODMU